MKKIIIISTLLMMCLAGAAFSGDLNSIPEDSNLVNLSQNVLGVYYSDNTGTNATAFAISTGHKQGGYAYATGSTTSSILRAPIAGAAFDATTDLLSDPADYNSATIEAFGEAI